MQKHITRAVAQNAKPESGPYQIHDTLIPGFVLRVQPSGKKIWKLIVKRKPRTLGTYPTMTVAQAEAKAKRILNGEEDQPLLATNVMTLQQFIDGYYSEYVHAHHSRPKEALLTLTRFNLSDHPLDQIRVAEVERFRTAKLQAGRRPATINRYITTLKATLQKAVDWDLLPVNPLSRMKPLKLDSSGVVRYLTKAEEERLYAALGDSEPWFRALVTLALCTGLRKGELLSLTWGDINNGTVTVHGGMAKTKQTRHVPLNATAAAALKDWRGDVASMPSLPVFGPRDIRMPWGRLLRDSGIENFTFHCTRHSFASQLVMAGCPLNTVRELLGHQSLKMTLRYAHLAPSNLHDAVALIG